MLIDLRLTEEEAIRLLAAVSAVSEGHNFGGPVDDPLLRMAIFKLSEAIKRGAKT